MSVFTGFISLTAILTLFGYGCTQTILPSYVHYNLAFKLIVKYPEAQLLSHGLDTQLYIVGNGLGLQWTQPTLLTKEVDKDTWSIDFLYNSTSDGYLCSSCSIQNVIPTKTYLEYRIMTSNRQDMLGANFGLNLEMSKAESRFASVNKPTFYAFPFFFSKTSQILCSNVTSSDSFVDTREWCHYLPPSFEENFYKSYKAAVSIDLNAYFMSFMQHYVDEEILKGHMDEMVLIGSGDYRILPEYKDLDRMELLTPSVSPAFACKEGDYTNGCNGCLPAGITDNRQFLEYMRDQCGVPIYRGGKGEQYLDHIVNDVVPFVQTLYGANRLSMNRDSLGIGGCSLGGLISCHALWTRPEVFGYGACQSSSFYWPMVDHQSLDNSFEFLNVTLKTRTGLRLPQQIYMDVADGEDDPYYAQVYAAAQAFDTMPTVSPYSFKKDENLRLVLVQNQSHCDDSIFSRAWLYFSDFNKPLGGSKNPSM